MTYKYTSHYPSTNLDKLESGHKNRCNFRSSSTPLFNIRHYHQECRWLRFLIQVLGHKYKHGLFNMRWAPFSSMSQVGSIPSESSLEDYVCSSLLPLRYKCPNLNSGQFVILITMNRGDLNKQSLMIWMDEMGIICLFIVRPSYCFEIHPQRRVNLILYVYWLYRTKFSQPRDMDSSWLLSASDKSISEMATRRELGSGKFSIDRPSPTKSSDKQSLPLLPLLCLPP